MIDVSLNKSQTLGRQRLSIPNYLLTGTTAIAIPMVVGFFYMTIALDVKPSTAAGIIAFSIAFSTIPASLGFYAGIRNRIVQDRELSDQNFAGVPQRNLLGLFALLSLLTLGLGAVAMYQLKSGKTSEALILLSTASAISLPVTIYLLMKMKRKQGANCTNIPSPAKGKRFWPAVSLVVNANAGLAVLMYGVYLLFYRQSIVSGILCVLLGLAAFVVLRFRAMEFDRSVAQ